MFQHDQVDAGAATIAAMWLIAAASCLLLFEVYNRSQLLEELADARAGHARANVALAEAREQHQQQIDSALQTISDLQNSKTDDRPADADPEPGE